YTRITPKLILGKYDSAQSAEYEFLDTGVQNGTVYEYILEDWEVSNIKTIHGPVAAKPDALDPWGEIWKKDQGNDTDDATDPEPPLPASSSPFAIHTLPTGEMEVSVSIPEPEITEITVNGKNYTKAALAGASLWDRQGEPEIPLLATTVEIPVGMAASAELIQSSFETAAAYPLVPVAERYAEYAGATQSVQQGTVKEGTAYSKEGWFPGSVFEIEDLGIQRDRHLVAIRVFPVRTDPTSGELELYKNIKLKLTFINAPQPSRILAGGSTPPPEGLQSSLKLGISSTGVYRITYSDLDTAGWLPLDPRNISLYDNGKEIPVTIQGEEDGSFDTGDYIEFYGISRVTQYADINIYWLVETGEPGLRIGTFDAAPSGTDLSGSSQEITVHREEDNIYSGTCPREEGADRWFWASVFTTPTDFTFSLDKVDTGHTGTCSITLTMHSLTKDDTVDPDHHALISLNGTQIGDITWDGKSPYIFQADTAHSLLNNGTNTVTVSLPQDTGAPYDAVYVDSVDITYHCLWDAAGNIFNTLAAGPGKITVKEFTSSDIRVLDITDPEKPAAGENGVITEYTPGSWSINFGTGTGTLFALLADSALLSPVSYEIDTESVLRSDTSHADMLIISYPDFLADIEPLAERRRSQGLSVRSVSIQDVYDEFSDGEPEPKAIQDFVKYTFENWKGSAPQYLILVGDATSDPLDRQGSGVINYIPTYLAYTEYLGETASDLYFACVAGDDYLPDLMVGRIPARSGADTAGYVQKVLAYEDQPYGGDWESKFILAADNETSPSENVFMPYSETLAVHASSQIERLKIYLDLYGDPADAHTDLITGLATGAALATYVGHSGFNVWADEVPSLLTTPDVDSLTNGTELPFVASFVCLDGFFILSDATYSCLGERFILNPAGGAIAAWSPSSITAAHDKKVIGDTFTRAIFVHDARTPAQAILPALEAGWAQGLNDIEDVLRTYILFGDPSINIRIATPVKPAEVSLKQGQSKILLTWDKNPEPTVHTYHIYRAESETGPYYKVNTVSNTLYRDKKVFPGDIYYYYVKAETDSGYVSSASNVVSGSPENNHGASGCMPSATQPASILPLLTAFLLLFGIRYFHLKK
ncbi:C25 family cysteine peptidase, partial [Planctomycetota bacterium]